MTLRPILTLAALACGLAACKQDPAGLDSGIAADKQGTELTPAEQAQLCEARDEYAASLISPSEAATQACTLTGILFVVLMGGDQAACETIRDGCLDEPSETTGGGTCDLGVDWTTCMATVAELEACYEENADALAAATRSLSCAKVEEYKTNPPTTESQNGPACSSAEAKCPTVLGTP